MSDTIVDTTTEVAEPVQALPDPPPNAEAYHRGKRLARLLGIGISLVYAVGMCWLVPQLVDALASTIHSPWLMLGTTAAVTLGAMVVVHLPLDYWSDHLLERRFDLTNQDARAWFVFQAKGWLVSAVIAAILIAGLYAALWYAGGYWSVYVWIGVMLFAVGLAKVFPLLILPIFYPSKPLNRPALTDRLHRLAEGTGIDLTGTYELELSKETKKANAMLAGLGSSRRVYLSDTLLNAFTDAQIGIVFAHELGHHIHRHIYKGIALTAVASSLMVGLIHWRLDPYAGNPAAPAAVAAFPQIMLIMLTFPLLIAPLTNAVSRHFERQCDRDALRLTNDPDAYREAFRRLTRLNLVDPDPPRWEELLFDDHPAMSKRIAAADEYVRTSP